MEIIDAHIHLIPPWRMGKLIEWAHGIMPNHPVPPDLDEAGLLADLDARGVGRFFNLVYPLRDFETEKLNRYNFELARRLPHVVPFGSCHVETKDKERLARRCFEEYGFAGFKFHPFVQKHSVTDERMFGCYEVLSGLGKPVFFHTGFDDFYGKKLTRGQIEKLL